MKLEFAWHPSPTGPQAICTSDKLDSNGVSSLACLLMDDGGLDRSTSLAWLREGIARVDTVLSGGTKGRTDWDREAWGAAVTPFETNVYSLHGERCAEVMPTPEFRRALYEWMKFIEAESGSSSVRLDLA